MTGTTKYRPADAVTILEQIGAGTLLAVNGGRDIINVGHGIRFATGPGNARRIYVLLRADDTYDVSRRRLILRGAKRFTEEVEYEASGIYADQLPEIVYQASLTD